MRSIASVVCFLVVLMLLSDGTFGQRKLIAYKEYFDGIYQKQETPWHERTRRVETLREEFSNGALMKSELSISEVVLPDRRRSYSKKIEGGNVKELEVITIDYFRYTRVDGGAWAKTDLRQAGAGVGYGSGSGSGSSRVSCTQYSVEPVVINGTPVKLFEMLDLFNVGNEINFDEKRNWIGGDGTLYRTEQVRGLSFPRVETWKEVVTYDFSSDLKITAPID